MSETTKKVSDAIKPVLAQSLAKSFYAWTVAIPVVGPFFALPGISHVLQFLYGKLAERMVRETAVGLSVLWITLDMMYEIHTVNGAEKRLRDMLENPQKYAEPEQQKIEDEYDDAACEVIQLSTARF